MNTRPVTSPPTPAAPPTADKLKIKGERLWELGYTLVQAATKDDRPLYWARLQAIAALRAYYRRNPNLSMLAPGTVDQFEWPSRGLDQATGGIIFPPAAVNARKAIVTGFDPFRLPSQPGQSNPSGLIALELNGKSVERVQPPVYVRSAIFPVRYRDFDANLVEMAMGVSLGSVALILTCSLNNSDYYDVERFAAKARVQFEDNENKKPAAVVPGNKEFFESTLPYERVVNGDVQTRRLAGPNRASTPFVTDQSYKAVGVTGERGRGSRSSPGQMPPVVPGSFRPEPVDDGSVNEEAAWKKQPDAPTGTALEGSGGSYLSNEIFYRTARERDRLRPALASGHFHLPLVTADTAWDRTGLIAGVKEALRRFLLDRFRMRSLGDVNFPQTALNRTSAPHALTAINETNATISVASVELAPPRPFALQTALPVAVNANSVLSLSFTFTPPTVGVHTSMATVRDAGGEVLFTATLTGEGIPSPPAPQITSFDPLSGSVGDVVTIFGTDLGGATAARIGAVDTSFVSIDDTRIIADVIGPPGAVTISVDTPSGTVTSA
ncbi:MAG TPA: IPT/TIG domain-containing protein, partial [Pyrinomonadaceae bacterium]